MGNGHSRRDFLRATTAMIAAGGVGSFVPKLSLMGTALAQSATTGYRAAVCVYLAGGNDSWNMLVPTEAAAHALYVAARNGLYDQATNPNGLGIPRVAGTAANLPPALALAGAPYGVNPFAPRLRDLYDEGSLAFVPNVGTLVRPLTRADYNNRPKPPQLYSHNDQSNFWLIGTSANSQYGWGGNVAGAVALPSSATQGLPPAISIAGNTRFLVGRTLGANPASIFPFQMSTSASSPATSLANYSATSNTNLQSTRRVYLEQLLAQASPELFSAEYDAIFTRSLDLADRAINPRIQSIPAGDPVNGGGTTGFTWPNTSLGNQLRQVARMVRISRSQADSGALPPLGGGAAIDANRQVFYVNAGGYDTHDGQIPSPTLAVGHNGLMQQLSDAVFAFHRAMQAIGAQNQVTLFSMSDFARTINSNGNGTDHAWGGVQFVVGGPQASGGPLAAANPVAGATQGTRIFGRYPTIRLDNRIGGTGAVSPDQGECFSRGQFLPTIAADQYCATIARWMGVDDANLPLVFPNIDHFVPGAQYVGAETPTLYSAGRTLPFLA